MKNFLGFIAISFVSIIATNILSFGQTRIAVLPFRNMNGDLNLTKQCYAISDSLANALKALEKTNNITIVPPDSVDALLATMNLDPTNPQYETDMWKAVQMLNVQKVVSGGFNAKYNKIFINAYIYDVKTKLEDSDVAARNIYKTLEMTMDAISVIVEKLKPGLK